MILACILILFAISVFAHDPSKSYLSLTFTSNQITGQWDIPLRDLQTLTPLAADTDGFISWEKLAEHYSNITAYALARLKIKIDGQPIGIRVTNTEPAVEEFADGSYVELPLAFATGTNFSSLGLERGNPPHPQGGDGEHAPKLVELDYQLFFDVNSLHRGLLKLEANGQTQSAVFTPEHRAQRFSLAITNPGRQFLVFLREGIWHIWTGYDHILFLLALLLPAVLQRERNEWRGVAAFRPAVINILKIVTAFTVAHSLTLSLATLGIVKLPTRLTESAIAASVILTAANNLWPVFRERGWMVAFVFGLIHGFGFATALSDLGLIHGALALTLVGFNLGVEIGQLAIVAIFLPIAFCLRSSWVYQKPVLRFGSALIMLIAAAWLVERVFDLKFLPV